MAELRLPEAIEDEIRTRLGAAFPQPHTIEIHALPFVFSATYGPGFGVVIDFMQADTAYQWHHASTTSEWTTPETLAHILEVAEQVGAKAKARGARHA